MIYFQAIDKSIDLTTQFLNNGQFQFELLNENLNTILEVGDAVNTSVTCMTAEHYEEFTTKISKLAYNIEQLSNKTRDLAVYFKELRTPFSVYAELFRSANSLSRLMQDTMFYPNAKCIYDFQEACRRNSLLNSILNVINLVEHDLNSDSLKFSDDFNNWKNAVNALLTQFLFINSYFWGTQYNGNWDEPNKLGSKIGDLLRKMDGGSGSEHWKKTVEELVQRTQDNNEHLDNSQKADLLRTTLGNMFKNDSFYVVVFNDCDFGKNLACDGIDNHYICSMKRGLCNVIVYRTREWKRANQYERTNFVNRVEACRNGVVPWWADYTGFPGILKNDHIQNTGFVGLIRKDQNPQVRSVNCENDGPGYWITARNKAGEEFILIAGHK
ncbi:hypothetical protein CAEBREN_23085 [Caenorhabditis brenneri]|uniref:Uncharacterized protein n=1 Tax=Caenorhabditis brenneri TaxID=135651 RepID=G0NN49_CAEBE|nr:hypothetical protein CAEBREN_23085 [Caenorhabditis brenneri]